MTDIENNQQGVDRKRVAELVNQFCSSLAEETEIVAKLVVHVLTTMYELDPKVLSNTSTSEAKSTSPSPPLAGNEIRLNENLDTSLAELMAEAMPKKRTERALIVVYWLHIHKAATTFTAFEVNKELSQLGYRSSNITVDLSHLMERKPQLVIQVQKSGKSKQGRKAYRLTTAGIAAAKDLLSHSSEQTGVADHSQINRNW